MKKIVVIGGGTGLSTLLRSIKDYPLDITAVVTMTDDGASTGRLRKDLKILPPGDIRKCIAALSSNEGFLLDLFQYRFPRGLGLKGHSFGNLWITALKEMTGNFETAIEETSRILAIKGAVLPSTLEDVDIIAEFDDRKRIKGESKIVRYGYQHQIKKIHLSKKAEANPKAIDAIKKADYIFIGPGSLYTSIIPNFLLDKIKDAVRQSEAPKAYISNVSTERGETDNLGLHGHCQILHENGVYPDAVIFNNRYFPPGAGDGYISPVLLDCLLCMKCNVIEVDLLNNENPLYHDEEKLGTALYKLISGRKIKRL